MLPTVIRARCQAELPPGHSAKWYLAAVLCPRCDPPGVTREGPTAVQSADVNTLLHTASGEKGMESVKGEFWKNIRLK